MNIDNETIFIENLSLTPLLTNCSLRETNTYAITAETKKGTNTPAKKYKNKNSGRIVKIIPQKNLPAGRFNKPSFKDCIILKKLSVDFYKYIIKFNVLIKPKDAHMNTIIKTLSQKQETKFSASTGSLKLDNALNGGLYSGSIYEIFGEESTGKTSIALKAIAKGQEQDLHALYIDGEFKLSTDNAKDNGVNPDKLDIIQCNKQESLFNFLKSKEFYNAYDIVVLDTLTSLRPEMEAVSKVDPNAFSSHASLTTSFMADFAAICHEHNIICIVIDQIRFNLNKICDSNQQPQKMGFENTKQFSAELVSSACNAVSHHATARIQLINKVPTYSPKPDFNGDVENIAIGQKTSFVVVKNHQGQPLMTGCFHYIFGSGISKELELADLGLKLNILTSQDGAIFYKKNKIATNKLEIIEFLKKDDALTKNILDNASNYFQANHMVA